MQHFILTFGYLAIFVLMLAESACIPIPSEVTMLFAGALAAGAIPDGRLNIAMVILAASIRERCVDPAERQALESTLLERLRSMNKELDPFERLSMIVIANGPWTVGNGFVTPTLKIKRGAVEDRYQRLVDDWQSQGRTVVWESIPTATAPMAAGHA